MTYGYRSNDIDKIIGQRVTALWVAPGEDDLRIALENASVLSLPVDGDCCSESWWADVIGVKQLIGGLVTAVGTISMPDTDPQPERSRQEEDQLYGIKITTTRGACDLIFRNSSNGYYGGSTDPYLTDSVPEDYRAITSDWSA